jgi:hypothetical protein
MADELLDAIRENLQGPKSASQDGRSATAHDLQQQIAAAEFLRQAAQGRKRRPSIRYAKFKSGDSV